jgi:hypothetical protein
LQDLSRRLRRLAKEGKEFFRGHPEPRPDKYTQI